MLPALFVLTLQRPLPVSMSVLDKIQSVPGTFGYVLKTILICCVLVFVGVESVVSTSGRSLAGMLVEQLVHVKLKDHDTLDKHSLVVST